jgi:hypothetical protein
MIRLAFIGLISLYAFGVRAQTVVDQKIAQSVEIIFYVKEGTNSPYQGRLLYTPTAPSQSQITADELAQYQTWKVNQILSPAQLTAQEIATNVDQISSQGSAATVTLVNSTSAQNLAALRTAYRNATQTQAVMIGDFLNGLTNAQLANVLSITTQQAQTLRTNTLAPAATIAASIRGAIGQ